MNVEPAFQGEVMLLGWSETHHGGAKVTFLLQDESDLAAFKAMTVAKGKTAGQRLAIVAVEIGDDEQPVAKTGNPVLQQDQGLKGGELAKLAGIFCQQPEFWEFADHSRNAAEAAEWIRFVCGISSRAELDHNDIAAQFFHEKIRKPYVEARK